MKSKVMTIANNLVKQGMTRRAAMLQAWITVKLRSIVTRAAGVTHGTVNDIYISGIVADNTPKTGETIWDRRCEIASAYGVGYILGKRAERARKKLRAMRKEKNA